MKMSTLLAYVFWFSTILLSWLMVTRQITLDFVTWFFWGVFLLFALGCSLTATEAVTIKETVK